MIPVLAAHGLGLGPWLFDAWVAPFAAAGLELRALTLPGHGDGKNASFADVVGAIERAADTTPEAILLGHSFAALAVQTLLARRTFRAAILVCPLPPGQVAVTPPLPMVRHLPRALATLALGRPYRPSDAAWRRFNFPGVPEAEVQVALSRCHPWPARLCRDLLRRPVLAPVATETPVLVVLGGADPIVPPHAARVVGDVFEAVVWRYDAAGHTPMLEPGGARIASDIAGFCVAPSRPRVLESEGFGPAEGVGHSARRARRGERMKRRSSYGQRAGKG